MAKNKCPRCKPCAAADWMLTFSDMMTLLLTFFVLLLSFSSISEEKFIQAVGSLKGALSVLQASNSAFVKSKFVPMNSKKADEGQMEEKIRQIMEQVQEAAAKAGVHDQVNATRDKDKIHFRLSDDMLFASGQAQLIMVNDSLFTHIVNLLKLVPYEIRVEGHTDNVPIATARYASNWELSSARALAVVRRFIDMGIPPQRFQVIGYGEYRPIASNSTTQGRQLNRRVEIFLNLKDEKTSDLPQKFNVGGQGVTNGKR